MAHSAFPKYVVGTNDSGVGLSIFVLLYVGFSFVITSVLVARRLSKWRKTELDVRGVDDGGDKAVTDKGKVAAGEADDATGQRRPEQSHQPGLSFSPTRAGAGPRRGSARFSFRSQRSERLTKGANGNADIRIYGSKDESDGTQSVSTSSGKDSNPPVVEVSAAKFSGKLSITTDSTNSESHCASSAGRATLDEADDVISELTGSIAPSINFNFSANSHSPGPLRRMNSKTPTENSNGNPSVATTSRLHDPSRNGNSRLIGTGNTRRITFENVGSRRNRRQSFRRIGALHNVSSMDSSSIGDDAPAFSQPLNSSFTSRNSRLRSGANPPAAITRAQPSRGISDVASSILDDPTNSTDRPLFNRMHRRAMRRRFGSFSSSPSEPSVLPSIIDDISPNDAADADDPGRGNIFDPDLLGEISSRNSSLGGSNVGGYGIKLGAISPTIETLLDLVDVDEQVQMLLGSSVFLTFMALMEPLLKLAMVALIAQFIGSESMIAFLLVSLFLRLTNEEMAGSIVDALSSFVQACIYSTDGNAAYLAGQYIQLGLILQCLMGVPLLLLWVLCVYDVTFWLVQSDSIAFLAELYTRAVVYKYMAQAIGKTFGVLFQINNSDSLESLIDMSAQFLLAVATGCIIGLANDTSLEAVGRVQVLIEVVAVLLKIIVPAFRGWVTPIHRGLLCSISPIQNYQGFFSIAFATLPLFAGAVIEYGEWELLVFFVRATGSAEVAAWLVLFSIWEVLEALTEGIGESAATLVASLLAVLQPSLARRLSFKAVYLSFVISVLVTGALMMCGRPLLVLLTPDPVLHHLMNETLGFIGLANVAMSLLHLLWSIAGAQGRFRQATSAVFFSRWVAAMPAAIVCIFVFDLNLVALTGSLVIGYTTANCILSYRVLGCNWNDVAKEVHELHAPPPQPPLPPLPKLAEEAELPEGIMEDFDDSDDDSSSSESSDESESDEESDESEDESSANEEHEEPEDEKKDVDKVRTEGAETFNDDSIASGDESDTTRDLKRVEGGSIKSAHPH